MKILTVNKELRELVFEFNTGAILLPQFQRDYVWKPAKIRNLLDSLLHGFPIGGFYLWRPASGAIDAKPKAWGERKIASELVGYLIDGQQRLTSLEAAYGLYSGADKHGSELRCYLDLAALTSEHRRNTNLFVSYAGHRFVAYRVDSADSTLIPINLLFGGQNHELRQKTEEALRSQSGWNAKRIELALTRFDRASAMLNQIVPCTTISEVSDKEAVEVFSRLNKGGTALRQGDVKAAELARGHAVNVLKRMREFVVGERPKRLGFGFSFAFRALVLFHRETAQFTTLKPDWIDAAGPYGRSLAQSWRVAEKAIDEALKFIDSNMGWSRRALLPSINAIIVLAAAFDKAKFKINDSDTQLYKRWLCLIALRGVFQGSVETTINRYFRAIKESKKSVAQALVNSLKKDEGRRIRPDELHGYGQMWGPATQVMHAWLVDIEAKDWLTNETVDQLARKGQQSFPGGDLTVHHIFPRKILSNTVDNPDDANCPANYALLSRSTNSEFGDMPPNEVFAGLTPLQRKEAEEQFFSEGAGDRLKVDQYEEFCVWRGTQLAKALNEWLGLS